MKHSQIQEWLDVYRELGGSERALLDRHIQECAECAARLRAYTALDRELANLRLPEPGPRVRQRFYQAVEGNKRSAREGRASASLGGLSRMIGQAAGAAGLLLLLLAIWAAFQALNNSGMVGGRPAPVPTETSAPASTPTPAPAGAAPPAEALKEYPLQPGNMWVYQSTRYEAVPITDYITATSTITETVVDLQSDPTYFAARIRREQSAEQPVFVAPGRQGEPLQPASTDEYWLVVKENRIYIQKDALDLAALPSTGELSLVLPLQVGASWHQGDELEKQDPDHKNGSMLWRVEQFGAAQVPGGMFDGCYYLTETIGGSTFENWFCPGIGWVDKKSDHHGTPFGSHQWLIKYRLGGASADVWPAAAPSATPAGADALAAALDRFMQARVQRDDKTVLDLMTEKLRAQVMNGATVGPVTQVSNPCWYRYLILSIDESDSQAQARVRVYQHFWPGDNAGGPPRSFDQEIGLVKVGTDWRVDQLGPAENEREQPNEPHGPNLSACIAAATPAPDGYIPNTNQPPSSLATPFANPTVQALRAELDRITQEELAHGCVETDARGEKVFCGESKTKVDAAHQKLQDAIRQAQEPGPDTLAQALASIRALMDDPTLQLAFASASPNSEAPDFRLMHTYTDNQGRYYQLDAATSTVVQFGPLPNSTARPAWPRVDAANLRAGAEAWLSQHLKDFAQVRATFAFSESSKGTTAAFRWEAPDPSASNGPRAVVQVVLATDGTILSFQDTRVLYP